MSYHQDWLTRQIEAISAILAFLLTGKKAPKEAVTSAFFEAGEGNRLAARLRSLVKEGQICPAENLLFAAMDENDPEAAEAAVQFYTDLNRFSEEALEQADFSREEIKEGLETVCRHYGLNFF